LNTRNPVYSFFITFAVIWAVCGSHAAPFVPADAFAQFEGAGAADKDPMALFDRANRAMREGDNENAAGLFMTICRNHPDSQIAPQASYYLGRTLLKLGRDAEALEVWDSYASKNQFIGNRAELFRLYVQFNLADKKLADLRAKAEKNPANYNSRMEYIEFLIFINRPDDAVAQYKELIAKSGGDYYLNKNIADLYVRFQRYSDAVTYYEKLVQRDPFNEIYLEGLGNCHYQLGDRKKAAEYWSRIIENTSEWNRYNFLAGIYQSHNMYGEAIAVYLKCQKLSSSPSLYFVELAELYEISGDFEGLLKLYFTVAGHSPSSLSIIESRLAETIKRNDEAPEPLCSLVAEKLKNDIGRDATRMKIAVTILASCKKFEKAYEITSKISEITNSPVELEEMADNLSALGANDLALKCFARIAELFPNTESECRAGLKSAVIFKNMKKYDEAVKRFAAVRDDKNFTQYYNEANFQIARIYFDELAETEKAALIFDELAGVPEWKDRGVYYKGVHRMYRGEFEKAREMFESIKSSKGRLEKDAEIMLGYLDIYSGTTEAGIIRLSDAIRETPATAGAADVFNFILALRKSSGKPELLNNFVAADRYLKGGAISSAEVALESFFTAAKALPTEEVKIMPDAALLKMKLFRKAKKMDKYKKTAEEIIDKWPASGVAPDAMYDLALFYADEEKNISIAKQYLEGILKIYPQSLLNKKAREKIAQISGGKDDTKKRVSFFGYI